jgi:hypothetical protein
MAFQDRLPALFEDALTDIDALSSSSEDPKPLDKEYLKSTFEVYCTVDTLTRFLRSRTWDLEKAVMKLKETLVWRSMYRPFEITETEVESEARSGNIYVNG